MQPVGLVEVVGDQRVEFVLLGQPALDEVRAVGLAAVPAGRSVTRTTPSIRWPYRTRSPASML